MSKLNRQLQVHNEIGELKTRLQETEETLHAIRQYLVDAFVVNRSNNTQVVTLGDADYPYRMMVEAMNEGAVTLIPDGTIFYCNPRFCEMVQMECEKLIGRRFQDLIMPDEQGAFEILLKDARLSESGFSEVGSKSLRGKFCLQGITGECIPVQLSVYQLTMDDASGISIIATDISDRIRSENRIRSLASKLTKAEQEERHRISQILHDDLQQNLFAIKTQLSLLNSAQENNISPAMQADLDQIQDWLSDAIDTARNLSMDLSPVVLQGEGLAQVLEWLSSQKKERYDLRVQVEVKENITNLDSHMRVLVFQAVRELLFNIVKHAGILQATITLEQDASRGIITVSDAGRGFDVESVMNNPNVAHGLLLLKERLELMGCKMVITSQPGKGTRTVIEIPMRSL